MKLQAVVMVVALATMVVAGCGGDGGNTASGAVTPPAAVTPAPGTLGISASPQLVPTPSTPAAQAMAITDANNLVYSAGARGQVTTFTWAAIEPVAGQFDAGVLNNLQSALDYAQSRSLRQFVGIQVINTTAKELPPDLAGRNFDDATVQSRFRLLLDRIVGANRGRIQYLSIGNEVDIYLNAHPTEIANYKTFYINAASYARLSDPAILVGVTGSAGDVLAGSGPGLLADLNGAASDVAILTYYPLQASAAGVVTVQSPSVVANDFTQMLTFAGSKPLVLQEVGYPASTLDASSQDMQATFVHDVFTAWKAAGGRIPLLNIFLLHDFTDATCNSLAASYGESDPSFAAYLCSLGLRTVDDTPREAWGTLVDEARMANLP